MKLRSRNLFTVLLVGSVVIAPALASGASSDEGAMPALNGVAIAEGGEGHHEGRPHERLSDEQLEKMAALNSQFEQSVAPLKAQMKVLHLQMRDQMLKSSVDRSAVQALQSKINALHDDLSTRFLNYRLDRMDLLTPTQREEFRHRMLMHEAFSGPGGHHHCGGGGWGHHGGHEHWKGHEGHEGQEGPGHGGHEHGHGGEHSETPGENHNA